MQAVAENFSSQKAAHEKNMIATAVGDLKFRSTLPNCHIQALESTHDIFN